MPFDDAKYTSEKTRSELVLIEGHLTDGSWRAGCQCVEAKHRLSLRGLASEGMVITDSSKEREAYKRAEALSTKLERIDSESEAIDLAREARSIRKSLESCSSGKCAIGEATGNAYGEKFTYFEKGNPYKGNPGLFGTVKANMRQAYADFGMDIVGDLVGKITDAVVIEYDTRYSGGKPMEGKIRTYMPVAGLVLGLVAGRYGKGKIGDVLAKAGSFLMVNSGVDVVQTVVLPATAGLRMIRSNSTPGLQSFTNAPFTFTR